MKILIITQKVDVDDSVLGFFHDWLLEFASRADLLTVICLEKGKYNLPKNVKVCSLGKEKKRSRILYLYYFYKIIMKEKKKYDTVFVHMNPIYIVLAGWYWRLSGIPVFLWYTHRHIDLKLRIAVLFAKKIFTASSESFQLSTHKIIITGHGINTRKFLSEDAALLPQTRQVLKIFHIGRLTPIKRCERLIEAVHVLKKTYLGEFELVFVGSPSTPGDIVYQKKLVDMVEKHDASSYVFFRGAVSYKCVEKIFKEADVIVNVAPTGGADKVVFEAMASGIPAIVSNETFVSFLGEYKTNLFVPAADPKLLADKIRLLLVDKNKRTKIGLFLKDKVKKEMDLNILISRLVLAMDKS